MLTVWPGQPHSVNGFSGDRPTLTKYIDGVGVLRRWWMSHG
jgi:hypothetical protein